MSSGYYIVPKLVEDSSLKRARVDNNDGTYSIRTTAAMNPTDISPVTDRMGNLTDSAWDGTSSSAALIPIEKHGAQSTDAIKATIGTTSDTSSDSTVIGLLKQVAAGSGGSGADLTAIEAVLGTTSDTTSDNTLSGKELSIKTNTASIATDSSTTASNTTSISTSASTIATNTGNAATAIGAQSDVAWSSGNGSLISISKAIVDQESDIYTSVSSISTATSDINDNIGSASDAAWASGDGTLVALGKKTATEATAIDTNTEAIKNATGTTTDSAWDGTSPSATVISLLKGICNKL